MMLVISLILALVPLLGIVWVVLAGTVTTVDGLFMSLILLAMSGILFLNALLELRKGKSGGGDKAGASGFRSSSVTVAGGQVQRGKVQSVEFYESNVGQPNSSVVVLSNGGSAQRMLVVQGDVRNALPVGQKVEVTLRKDNGNNVLVNVNYG
ncbi:MAG: hypothetical protein LAO03_13005 [Acidobacteriia bacterium]|nr:hypothetical protein [Terriglobia bacterium]